MNVCFLAKKEKIGVEDAIIFLRKYQKNIDVYFGEVGDAFPETISRNSYDLIISYISPWIVPKKILEKTKKWNINFHPGSPDYPGIGCFNFAIYDLAEEYGATAHLMNPKVDTGAIIGVKRFSMNNLMNVQELSLKTYKNQLLLFYDVMNFIFSNNRLPNCKEKWKRKPFTRKELEKLATIDLKLTKEENDKKINATYYPGKPAPFIFFQGNKYEYNPTR